MKDRQINTVTQLLWPRAPADLPVVVVETVSVRLIEGTRSLAHSKKSHCIFLPLAHVKKGGSESAPAFSWFSGQCPTRTIVLRYGRREVVCRRYGVFWVLW